MSSFETPISAIPADPYRTLLEMSRAMAAHTSVDELVRELGRRLHNLLDFTYLTLMIHDDVRDVMLTHTVHTVRLLLRNTPWSSRRRPAFGELRSH